MTDPVPSHPRRWAILWVVCAALMIVVVDVTVLHVAAPAISADLDPTAVQLLWIIDIYSLVAPPLLLAAGLVGDRIGRRTVMSAGLVVFGVASLAAALSPSPAFLIGSRALLGVGGAMILPATMSIVRDVFRDRAERVKAVGVWSAVSAGGAALGPLLGGFLVEHISWHAVFLINVPIVIAVLPFAVRLLPRSRAADPPPWDSLAILLGAVAVLGLAFGIKEGARNGFGDREALVALALGAGALAGFCVRQIRSAHPLLDVRLFVRRDFTVAVGAVFLGMFALVGIMFFGAQYMQLVLDLEPLTTAIRLLPLMLATLVGGLIAAPLLSRLGTRWAIALGLGLTAAGLAPMLWLGLTDEFILIWPGFILIGLALQVALVAANDVIIAAVPADEVGGVAAIEEIAYELGSGFGIAILGSVLTAVYSSRLGPVAGVGASALDSSREAITRAFEIAGELPAAAGAALIEAARGAFVAGYHAMIVTSVLIIAFAALASLAALRPHREPRVGLPAVSPGPTGPDR